MFFSLNFSDKLLSFNSFQLSFEPQPDLKGVLAMLRLNHNKVQAVAAGDNWEYGDWGGSVM